jgi:long-chain fatty acid transport protein
LGFAGGFDRFGQDVSLLFEPADVVFDASASYLLTSSHFETVNRQPEQVPALEDYAAASFRIKQSLNGFTDCLVGAGRPFGSDIDYGTSWSNADQAAAQRFHVAELALTCSARASIGSGYIRGIAGASFDTIRYLQTAVRFGILGDPVTSSLRFDSDTYSWRAGLAYEVPSAAFVVSLMYFAPLNFELDGHVDRLPLAPSVFLPSVPVSGDASIPQAVEASIRGAIAPGWLAGLGFKWVDWSNLDHVPLLATSAIGPLFPGTQVIDLRTYFRDGLTAAVYLGHQLDSRWSIMLRTAWDRGVATGWTKHTDTWSLQTIVRYKINEHLEMRTGVNAALLTPGSIDKGAFKATWGQDYAIIPELGITMRF